jgi:hypothetical protein
MKKIIVLMFLISILAVLVTSILIVEKRNKKVIITEVRNQEDEIRPTTQKERLTWDSNYQSSYIKTIFINGINNNGDISSIYVDDYGEFYGFGV